MAHVLRSLMHVVNVNSHLAASVVHQDAGQKSNGPRDKPGLGHHDVLPNIQYNNMGFRFEAGCSLLIFLFSLVYCAAPLGGQFRQ